jgi:hypothetical protein
MSGRMRVGKVERVDLRHRYPVATASLISFGFVFLFAESEVELNLFKNELHTKSVVVLVVLSSIK